MEIFPAPLVCLPVKAEKIFRLHFLFPLKKMEIPYAGLDFIRAKGYDENGFSLFFRKGSYL